MSKCMYYLIIPCLDDSKLLMVKLGGQWQLPYVKSEIHYSECASFLIRFINETYNIKASILGLLDFQYDDKTDTLSFYFITESYSDVSCIQKSSEYFIKDEIEGLKIKDVKQIEMIERWFELKEKPIGSQQPEWMQRGWLLSLENWIENQLKHNGSNNIIAIEPVKLWYRGYVMRIDTDQGTYYFKAVPKGFRIENLLALDFARQLPDNSPVIVAEEVERGWILMKSMRGKDLMDVPDEELWVKAVRTYARIQIRYSSQVEKLMNMGCINRSLAKLYEMLPSFASEGLCMQPGLFGTLSPDEIKTFNCFIPEILDDCKKLVEFGIPTSIEHGDLTPRNVKVTDSSITFFDWSDCSVSHPFFSLRALFGFLEVVFPNNNSIRNLLRDAYISEWESHRYGNVEKLTEAFELADKLAPLHMSMTYHLQILPVIERKEECIGTESLFIRWLLKQYSEGNS